MRCKLKTMGALEGVILKELEKEALVLYKEGASYEDAVKFLTLKVLGYLAEMGIPSPPPSTEKRLESEVRHVVSQVWATLTSGFCDAVAEKAEELRRRGFNPEELLRSCPAEDKVEDEKKRKTS